jgi:acyl carrier protein
MSKLTFKQKQAHYEKVRRSNYLASLRLAGFDTSPADLDMPLSTREDVIAKYRQGKQTQPALPKPDGYPAMNLAPNFPDDHAMHLLMQLLHEELGLPERKMLSLSTSINFDLGCDGADARHLMEALEEQFGIDFVDYDAYRYFQPEGFDVFLKRRAKGRGDKVPLTIGMLYRAIKVQRWDTQGLEGL